MNVYRVQRVRIDDGEVRYHVSHYVEGRLGNTHPTRLSITKGLTEALQDIQEDAYTVSLHAEFRIECNLHDGGDMQTGDTCLVCGMVGCDTPFAMPEPQLVKGPVENAVEGYYCKVDETDY